MSLSEVMTDTVVILKKNGEEISGVKASVQTEKTFIDRSDILIESGDLIQRKMSNGGEETYEVIDPGFYEAFGDAMPAHYQISHKKLGFPEAKTAVQSITYNVTGSNARINNQSTDNSINIVHVSESVSEHIEMLRSEVNRLVNEETEKQECLEIVDAIESQFSLGNSSKAVMQTLLSRLPDAGSIASIGSFLLAALSV